ncbi:MAG: hypothetical protein QOF55_901 [Thermoleophilaceae bacterium]|jgi:hypothetical protein|nr:hypothetical protein [Thermoleophilaceae bacterium]
MVLAAVSMPRSASRLAGRLLTLGVASVLVPAAAQAAAPPNDAPSAAAAFTPVTAENGRPSEQQGIAELVEATPDPGVPQCLGASSFARTVWFVVPAAETPQEIDVEATGRTLDPIDLAAFVQFQPPSGPITALPNACSGIGAGGSDAAEEPNSGVTLRVPAHRPVLIQVGRRGGPRSADDERAVVILDTRALPAPLTPLPGDSAGPGTPKAQTSAPTSVALGGATIGDEDPAQPPCPSLGTVWRRVIPTFGGTRLISVSGNEASTLTVFGGTLPTAGNALDCVNRVGHGPLQMRVPARAKRPLWIRIGADRPPGAATASLSVGLGTGVFVVDGGPGGSDPTPGGPGAGFPTDCDTADAQHARIVGAAFGGNVKRLNRARTVGIGLRLQRGPVCDVVLDLIGPGGRVYASSRTLRLQGGNRRVALVRSRPLRRGGYRLRVSAVSRLGDSVLVPTQVRGTFR